MESKHLFTFLVVVETGSFTRAAQKLDYAQSSITAQIQALEAELGQPLFDRISKKIMLTDAGRRLLPYAQEISKMHTMAENALRSETEIAGSLRIGAPESLAAFRLPGIIKDFRSRYPQVQITLKPGACWELTEFIRSGELDLAFLLQPETEYKDIYCETLIHEAMALVAPLDHPLLELAEVEPHQLKNVTILHTEAGCTYRTLFERHLNSHGVFPDPNLEFWSIEAIKQCVMAGLGLSFLPQITVKRELAEGKLGRLNWNDQSQRVATQIAYHNKKWKSPALSEFLRMVEKHAAGWREATAEE
ncbi:MULTISPECIES: LysR family transcriptional regulator [Paenibacillus]|uniref:DNA-binding transcriptional LysR family regulator n=1 Tax=Paenibacillus silagei TaxID=1670801 RepID=A0ABS4NRI4_9BACL|nr:MULTISPECIES: LysR family transcriptional regulator [Paenibacillus]ETT70310.1 transcriptional regulator yusT [Paenibacillus sp. FSL R7-277]MBP2112663.1 DNA-binding transcriptional LysR family regulator [Paenibacillus silagei]